MESLWYVDIGVLSATYSGGLVAAVSSGTTPRFLFPAVILVPGRTV